MSDIKPLFSQPYQRESWLDALQKNIHKIEIFSREVLVKQKLVDDFYYLGIATLSCGTKLGIYEVRTNAKTQLHRNRVQMRNLVAKQCQFNDCNGAMAVYHNDNANDNAQWRFSFISIGWELQSGKLVKTQTPTRRYTYLLGVGRNTRTVVKRFETISKESDLKALEYAFSVEPLTKEFYQKLSAWYERAKTQVKFPNDERVEDVVHKQNSLIRLITRLLFVWFIKEKGLVNRKLFDENKIKDIIEWNKNSSYYKAILQNLFFATLNREITKRDFCKSSSHFVTTLFRYQKSSATPLFKIADQEIKQLFAHTPFLNGGLFECLDVNLTDAEKSKHGKRTQNSGLRIDGFSSHKNNPLKIDNALFFNEDEKELGLINLLHQYQFTTEESTPADIEVALDPELLGKVFENLLASYNPETGEQARKATGSFYTPREIVGYMVDESLKQHFKQNIRLTDQQLDSLFDESDSDEGAILSDAEKEKTIAAISTLKVLDPAVGSGAFPMGILQRMVSLLEKLDPENKKWKNQQIHNLPALDSIKADLKIASKISDKIAQAKATEELKKRKKEIKDLFSEQDDTYLRKLHLIQNSIFGVDIQPIACQIAKLRFFISLAIEQQSNTDESDNYGIKPLPNLETKFIAADTLIYLNIPAHSDIFRVPIEKKEKELQSVRQKYFNAKTFDMKNKYRQQDENLRTEIADILRENGVVEDKATSIADWSPYQSTAAEWFDAKFMFGVNDGFDVVISNPPYINVETIAKDIRKEIMFSYATCEKRTDIYIAFFEKSMSLLNSTGTVHFIVPHSFTTQKYGEKMRHLMATKYVIQGIVDASSYSIFENATVFNVVIHVGKKGGRTRVRHHNNNDDFKNPPKGFVLSQSRFMELKECRFETRQHIFNMMPIKQKLWNKSRPFKDICLVAYGARLNHKSDKIGKSHYISKSPIPKGKKFTEGKNIQRYHFSSSGWLDYRPNEHYNSMFCGLFESKKLMCINVVSDRVRFAYDSKKYYNSHTVINCVRLDKLKNESHVTAIRAVKKGDIVFAKKFDYKFLLGILNSSLLNWYFLSFLSEKLHCYPDDVKNMPIHVASESEQIKVVKIVNQILAAKSTNPNADTNALENQIDNLVYKLYDLSDSEINLIKS